MKPLIITSILALTLQLGAAPSQVTTSTATTTTTTADGTKVIVSMEKDGKMQTRTFKLPAMPVTPMVRPGGTKEKVPQLGIALSKPSEDLLQHLGLPRGVGVLAAQVLKDSPAAAAGMKGHDLLTRIDEQILFNVEQTVALIRSLKPGQDVKITFYRGGAKKTATATLTEAEITVFDQVPTPDLPLLQFPAFTLPFAAPTNILHQPPTRTLPNPAVNHQALVIDQSFRDLILQSYAQAASVAATNPSRGRQAVLIKKSGGNTLVQELAEVHAKVKQAVAHSLEQSEVAAATRKKILADLDKFLKSSAAE